MTLALLQVNETMFQASHINDNISSHPAWIGKVSGLYAEKMLRGSLPYTYVLRGGETSSEYEQDYYVTFALPDGSIKHQPFVITITEDGWCWENHGNGGPHIHEGIDHVLNLIMHCDKDQMSIFAGV